MAAAIGTATAGLISRRFAMARPAALKAAVIAPSDETAEAAEIVEKFLVASMVPDPETAARYIAEPLKLTFTGGRKFRIRARARHSTPSATSG